MNIQDIALTCFASMPQKAVERQFSMGVSRFRTPCRGTDVIHSTLFSQMFAEQTALNDADSICL